MTRIARSRRTLAWTAIAGLLGCGPPIRQGQYQASPGSVGGSDSGDPAGGSGPASSGGWVSSGGSPVAAGGGPSGGTPALGGQVATGGAPGAGGVEASGGIEAVGGLSQAGGADPGGGGTLSSGGAPAKDPVFHVFILIGQSNMVGFPKATGADLADNPRISVLGYDDCAATGRVSGQWAVAVPPLHECWGGAIGPGDYFAKKLIDMYPPEDTIGLVPTAISGEKIETFLKAGGPKYSWILQRAKIAQQANGVIEGFLFHQGESNTGQSGWPAQVKTLISDLKSDLGIGDVPFIAGELLYGGCCQSHNTYVNQLPGLIPNAGVVSAQGLSKDPSDTYNAHFDHSSQITLGQRYADKFAQIAGL